MKAKSLAISILSAAIMVVGAFSGYLNGVGQAWAGVIAIALTLISSTFFPSGTIVKGWNWVMWATSISAIVIQVLNAILEKGLMSPELVNGIIMAINIFIQAFLKDYTGTGSIVEKKLL